MVRYIHSSFIRITFLAIGLVASQLVLGQSSQRGVPIRVSLLNETVSLPSISRLVNGINPGLAVGTEFYYGQRRRHRWLQSLNIAGLYHQELATSLLVTSELGYRLSIRRVSIDLKAGPGYIVNRSAAPIYRDTGTEYVKTAGIEHRLIVTTGLAMGVQLGSVTPFLEYNVMVQTPFLQNNSPFLPHQLLQVGVATRIGRSKPLSPLP